MALFDSLSGIGLNAATGNYVGAGIQAVGLGVSIFGGAKQASDAKQAYGIQQQIAGQEQQVQQQKYDAMVLQSRRSQMEIFRQNQRARALAQNNAVNQNAQFGSGLQGGLAQVNAESGTSLVNNAQNLSIGQNIFGINNEISKSKLALSKVQSQMATDQGIASLGGSISKAGDPLGRLYGQLGAGGQIGTFSFGGNDGMAPSWS